MPAAPPPTHNAPNLPTELVQWIIRLALPPPTFTCYKERYSILLKLCRVSRMWRALGQQELFAHAWIRTARDAVTFMDAQSSKSAASNGAWTSPQSLWIDAEQWNNGAPSTGDSKPRLSLLLKTCGSRVVSIVSGRGLKSLKLGSVPNGVAPGELTIAEASEAQPMLNASSAEVLELTLDQVWSNYLDKIEFASLRRLTLRHTFPFDLGVLAQGSFPQLETLILVVNVVYRITNYISGFSERLGRVAPQLRTLSLCTPGAHRLREQLPTTFWSSFKHLQRLVIDFNCHCLLQHLPSALQHLRLRPIKMGLCSLEPLINLLKGAAPSLARLETLTIPSYTPHTMTNSSGGISREELAEHEVERGPLRFLCQERGIELLEKKNFDENFELGSLEDTMDVW